MAEHSIAPRTMGTALHPPPEWVLAQAHNDLVARVDVLEKRIEELEAAQEEKRPVGAGV